MVSVDISTVELKLLIASLDHCIATCHSEEKGSSGSCGDCEAAKALRQRLITKQTA